MTSLNFPDPFSDAVVEEMKDLIQRAEINDLTVALDAKINSQIVPEWYRNNILSRIYNVLLELSYSQRASASKGKIASLLAYMKKNYREAIYD